MLNRQHVKEVLVQASYMSGDRNTIASALRVNPDLGILILTPPGSAESGDELKNFYTAVSSSNRVEVLAVPATQPVPDESLRAAYKAATNLKRKRPDWLSQAVAGNVKLQTATYGTKVISNLFSKKKGGLGAEKARALLQDFWRLEKAHPDLPDLENRVGEWLTAQRFDPRKRYVFLFTKEGDRYAEKAHHFTSIGTWRLLVDKLRGYARESRDDVPVDVIPVAAGDPIGLETECDLTRFWLRDSWKSLFEGLSIDGRRAQLGLWCYLAMQYGGVSIIGMRSGMIEVPALVGIRTLYLEEEFNQQAARMARWIGNVPGFERQVVQRPPGIKQQLSWQETGQYAEGASLRHLQNNTEHLKGMTMGSPMKRVQDPETGKIVLNERTQRPVLELRRDTSAPPTQQQLMRAIQGKDIAEFGLRTDEWAKIMSWVRNTPPSSYARGQEG